MSFPRYAKYKDSGVEWLGEVPEHWQLKATKRLFRLVVEPAPNDNDYMLLSIYTEIGVRPRKELEAKGNKATTTDGYWMVQKGDLIVNKLLAWMGAIGISDYDGVTSPAYDILRRRIPLEPRYYEFLFRCGICFAEFRRHSRGIMDMRLRLYFDELGQLLMPFPPEEEQQAIISFLDREKAKIDGLVDEQRRLLELLKEKRQAVISHAVTKGMNPHAPMKPSGIEWLGDVPEHWAVTPIGHLCDYISYGFTNPMPTTEDGPFLLTANDIDYGRVKYDTARRTSSEAFRDGLTEKSRPKKDDVLITKDGTLGRVALHDGQEACINQSVASLRVRPNSILPEYMATCLLGGIYQGRMIYDAGGTTIKHIYISRLAKMPIAYPTLSEQEELLAFLRGELLKLEELTSEIQRGIELLQERRTALISAAVTGKIDVRGLVQTVTA
jgi:type I restriction enzyme S subunit